MSNANHDAASAQDVPLAFEWRPDIDRLKDVARDSKKAGHTDPFTIVEAECWLDLVKAEIAAQRALKKSPETKAGLEELRYWRSSLRQALRTLKSIERSD